MKHKNPYERFIIYPQLLLKWSPGRHDRRAEIHDVGVGNITVPGHNPPFKLCFGVEVKRAIASMGGMPPALLIDRPDVVYAFHRLSFQAKNQAKAAIKNNYPIASNIQWILLIGPYWIPVTFGPFTNAELSVRAFKESASAYLEDFVLEQDRVKADSLPLQELYLLCEDASDQRLEQIIALTDGGAQPLINAMA